MPSRIEPDQSQSSLIRDMRARRYSFDAIAAAVGATRGFVIAECNRIGCDELPAPALDAVDPQTARVIMLRNNGATCRAIAGITGMSVSSVEDIVSEFDLRAVTPLPAMHPATWGAIALPCHA